MFLIAKLRAGRFLSPIIMTASAAFFVAGTSAGPPLGTVVTAERVVIGSASAPTGTTVFSGDRIRTQNSPALISFVSGSRVEMIHAGATFKREGEWLVIQPEFGLLRFNFKEKENVRIAAGGYVFTASSQPTALLGSLVLNHNGQIALGMEKGIFDAKTAGGERRVVTSKAPLVVLEQLGLGRLRQGGDHLLDESKSWMPDELEGMSIRVDGEAHEVVSNSENTIYIDGTWRHDSGTYRYEIAVSRRIARIPILMPPPAGQSPTLGLSAATVNAIAPKAAYAAGAGIGFRLEEKTESSR